MQTKFYMMKRYLKLLGIMLMSLHTDAGCPSQCKCWNSSVQCREKGLGYVPNFESLEITPKEIDLSGNNIQFLEETSLSFEKAESVLTMYLNNSNIVDIDESVFVELTYTKVIYLSDNTLSSIPTNVFKKNIYLVVVDLSGNNFFDFPKLKSASLEELLLMNAGISHVATNVLEDIPKLRILYLQKNNIQHMSASIFKPITNKFFTKLNFNPWECTCQTVELFGYLLSHQQTTIEETIQCKSDYNYFISIYDQDGPMKGVKEACSENKSTTNTHEIKTLNKILHISEQSTSQDLIPKHVDHSGIQHPANVTNIVHTEPNTQNYSLNFISLLSICTITFIVGLFLGGSISYFRLSKMSYARHANCQKSLINSEPI